MQLLRGYRCFKRSPYTHVCILVALSELGGFKIRAHEVGREKWRGGIGGIRGRIMGIDLIRTHYTCMKFPNNKKRKTFKKHNLLSLGQKFHMDNQDGKHLPMNL